jgi:RNA polymerase sigma-70 factor (ECF subfamily)
MMPLFGLSELRVADYSAHVIGDEAAFGAIAERYRRQLHVHCYRMLGSFDDAEDLVQETLLRAWRARAGFEGRSSLSTWLYRIATNACLNALERAPRRVMPQDVAPPVTADFDAADARSEPPWAPELPWLQPYPDHLLDHPAPSAGEPPAATVARETIELAFLAALQHLPPRQRAVLILRDVLDWSAKEVAAALDLSVASANSVLQRARASMRAHLPHARDDWAVADPRSDDERSILGAFMSAWEQADAAALTDLLLEQARWAMPPAPLWFVGRVTIMRVFELFPIGYHGDVRALPTASNRQPAAAMYVRARGESLYALSGVHVLRIERARIAEITSFSTALCGAFDLPATLSGDR